MSKITKWYLKDTDKQIFPGDAITLNCFVKFARYPEDSFQITVAPSYVDKNYIALLEEIGFVEKHEEEEVKSYTVYLKWLAETENVSYGELLNAFNLIYSVNPSAAVSFILKTISKNRNKSKSTSLPRKVWLIDITTNKPCMTDVDSPDRLSNIAWFISKEDAEYALKVCAPLLKH